jgi:1-acyl-sn-glycerol-3-phosphate acyltransferase
MMNTFRGISSLILYTLNFIVCGLIVFALTPLLLFPLLRNSIHQVYQHIPRLWTLISNFILKASSQTEWIIHIDPTINKEESYIVIANHQSWFDIIALQKALSTCAPPPVYLMKRALLWVPVMGWACWLLDFPFVYRFTKQYLEQHPEKKGLDLKKMQETCEHYRNHPVTFINFVEGTRFTKTKQSAQNSPYQTLLKPRGGGLAFTLHAMGDKIQYILNADLIYSPGNQNLWQMLCAKRKTIRVDIKKIKVEPSLRGDYQNDLAYRETFQNWLNKLWQDKDSFIQKNLKN